MREPRPVIRAEVTEKNKTLRIVAAVVLLVIGIIALTSGFMSLLGKDPGWQEIQINTKQRNCSQDFTLQYHFSGANAAPVNNLLQSTYEEACVKAYQLFTPDEEIEGVHNIHYINRHPNEEITVDPVLYAAFRKLEDTRYLYLGPIYAHYSQIIYNTDDPYVQDLDPAVSGDAAAYIRSIHHYAIDPDMIRLELLGDNRIKLHVSQEYLAYARGEEIGENFIDFSYLTNAFIIDYLADSLVAQGLTDGFLVSADGFTRTLVADPTFRMTVFDRVDTTVYAAGVMEYRGPVSIVSLKDYPVSDTDRNYRGSGNHNVHLFADPADGMYRTGTENLISYSYDTGCVEVLLNMLPSFLGDSFSVPEGLFSVWCENGTLCYNDPDITIDNLHSSEAMTYTTRLVD